MPNKLTPADVSRFWIAERVRQAAASTARRRANAATVVRAMAQPDGESSPGGEATKNKAVPS